MPYSEDLDMRVAKIVAGWMNITRKKMFGGVCYLMNGNMLGGVYKDFLIARIGEDSQLKALKKKSVRHFDITGKPMKGWIMVEPRGYEGKKLAGWLKEARTFVAMLPPKSK